MSNFREKYLKYKAKYLALKNQQGGDPEFEQEIIKLDEEPNKFLKEFREKHMKRDMLTNLSLVPGLKSELAYSYGLDVEMLYKYVPNDDQIKTFKNDMYLVDYVAKNRNIKVYFSSWDRETHALLNKLTLKNSIVLPLWSSESKEQADSDLARDRKHPGPIHHKQWVNSVREFIK